MPKVQLENGRILDFEKEPTPEDIDFAISQSDNNVIDATGKTEVVPFLPGRAKVQEQIAQRPSALQTLGKELATQWNPAEHPVKFLLKPAVTALKVANVPFQALESAVANPALELQAGKPERIPLEAIKGLLGMKSGQLGDIIRTTGFGSKVNVPTGISKGLTPITATANELLAAGAGGLAALPLANMAGKALVKSAQGVANIPTNVGRKVSGIRDYPANKVNAIRKGFWNNYAPKEYKAYADGVENLGNVNAGSIQGDLAIQNLEKRLLDKGLMATDGTLQKGFTPADNKLIKAYQNISKKWAESKTGELPVKDVIDEWKIIRGKYTGKPNPTQVRDIQAANDFFDSISDQINIKEFSKVKARYREFKNNQQLIHEAIDLYAPEMKTARGERFLTKGGLSETTQGRKTAGLITKKSGQTLKGAKALTKVGQLNPLRLIGRR